MSRLGLGFTSGGDVRESIARPCCRRVLTVYVDGGLGDVGGEPGHGGDTSQPAAVVVDRQDETAARAGAALGPRRQQPQTRTTRHTHLQKHEHSSSSTVHRLLRIENPVHGYGASADVRRFFKDAGDETVTRADETTT